MMSSKGKKKGKLLPLLLVYGVPTYIHDVKYGLTREFESKILGTIQCSLCIYWISCMTYITVGNVANKVTKY